MISDYEEYNSYFRKYVYEFIQIINYVWHTSFFLKNVLFHKKKLFLKLNY